MRSTQLPTANSPLPSSTLVFNNISGAIVLSYLTLRRSVGWIALGLPFALAMPWWFLGNHVIESSISGYYYSGMRNLFVGCLCAISMFMFCCRGYDRYDEMAGGISALCAIGVAFCPTKPDCATPSQQTIGVVHYVFAAVLFSTLACICFFLFTKTANKARMTRQKRYRNKVYIVCGSVIFASMLLILALRRVQYLFGPVTPMFCFETTSLMAFGTAWLVKGETFLKDETPQPEKNQPINQRLPVPI